MERSEVEVHVAVPHHVPGPVVAMAKGLGVTWRFVLVGYISIYIYIYGSIMIYNYLEYLIIVHDVYQ